MKAIIFVFIGFSLIFSCKNHIEKEKKNDFKLQSNFEYVHLVPDSLRTPEQQKLCNLIFETIVRHLEVKNNHLTFNLSESDFSKLGIPKPYYDLLQHNLKEANHFFDSENIINVDSILNESYKNFYTEFKIKSDK